MMMAMVMTSIIKLNQNEKVIIKVEVRWCLCKYKKHTCVYTFTETQSTEKVFRRHLESRENDKNENQKVKT